MPIRKLRQYLLVLALLFSVINYPNPFNPQGGEKATFSCSSDISAEATLYIYDMAAHLVSQQPFTLNVGTNQQTWNGLTNANELAGNGIYLYRLVNKTSRTSLGKGKIWIINK